MAAISKLLAALAAVAFTVTLASAASAKVRKIEQDLKPKDSFKECDVCPEMVWCRKAPS